MEANQIYIVCEHAFSVYAAKIHIEKLRNRGRAVVVFTPGELELSAKKFLELKDGEWMSLDPLDSPAAKRLTRLFEAIFVPHDFSESYLRRRHLNLSSHWLRLARLTKPFKLNRRNINRTYSRLCRLLDRLGFLPRLPGNPSQMISFTKAQRPYLLARFENVNTLVMESWDHPMKDPYFVNPRVHVTWNSSLAEEVSRFQNIGQIETAPAEKFEYIREGLKRDPFNALLLLDEQQRKELQDLQGREYAVYPMCTSSNYFAFDGELRFVKDLAKSLSGSGILLYIRPYPLAPLRDHEALTSIENVYVGAAQDSDDGRDVLDESAQNHKFLLIQNASMIINVGTTFAIDAALIGTDVLQLKLDDDSLVDRYGDFLGYSRGVHIVKHLWHPTESLSFNPDAPNLQDSIRDGVAERFSGYLRDWVSH